MSEPTRVFISYRNLELSRAIGYSLNERLEEAGFLVYFDQTRLKEDGGVQWEDALEQAAREAEVLLILVQPETGESEWVKREIATVREAGGAVVPLIVVDKTEDVVDTMTQMDLDQLQWLVYDPRRIEPIIDSLRERGQEVKQHRALRHGRSVGYRYGADPCEIFLVNNDATIVRGYDVLVNSENTFMQMARFFESDTLSAHIRYKGAYFRSGFMIADTVQDQLNHQVQYTEPKIRPIRAGQVLVTPAGHPDSELAQNFRFIFHAATVVADWYEKKIMPMSARAIPDVVKTCIQKLEWVNQEEGAVIYDEDGNRPQPAWQSDLKSILFPLMASGKGGMIAIESAQQILIGLKKYLDQNPPHTRSVRKIGVCVFDPEDAREIDDEFVKQGFERVMATSWR